MKELFSLCVAMLLVFSMAGNAQNNAKTANLKNTVTISDIENSDTKLLFRANTNTAVGVSCSSKDGTQDCFCTGGCRRTQSSCSCTGTTLTAETPFEPATANSKLE